MAVSSRTIKNQTVARRWAFWTTGGVDKPLFLLISCLGLILAGLAGLDTGLTGLALVGLGLLLGMAFMGFQYGFASGWRRFLETGDASALSLHFLLAALCALIFIPVSAAGLGPSRVTGACISVAFHRCVHVWHRHATCQWMWVRGAVQLWWRIRPDDCGFAIFRFWIRAGVDHFAARIGMGVAWSDRDRRGAVRRG